MDIKHFPAAYQLPPAATKSLRMRPGHHRESALKRQVFGFIFNQPLALQLRDQLIGGAREGGSHTVGHGARLTMLTWSLPLGYPPTISLTGRGRHGQEPVERFRVPHLWGVHLYEYEAELLLNGVAHRLHPGSASIIAPDTEMEYRSRGESRHLFAHFSLPHAGRRAVVTVPQDQGADFAAVGDNATPPGLRALVGHLLAAFRGPCQPAGSGRGSGGCACA